MKGLRETREYRLLQVLLDTKQAIWSGNRQTDGQMDTKTTS